MTRIVVLILLVLGTPTPGRVAFLAAAAPSARCRPQFAPLESTQTTSGDSGLPFWRASEAGDWRGTGWLGWSADGDRLDPVGLTVRPRPKRNPQDDDEVYVTTRPRVAFAVRCVAGLTAGRIVTVQSVQHDVANDGALHLTLGAHEYRILLETRDAPLLHARVILTDGQRSQVLYDGESVVQEGHLDIVWAGDLDRDGKLDLVVSLFPKDSWYPYELLLSSRARGKNLVGRAALFETGD